MTKKSHEIHKLVIGLFETNCYILVSEEKNTAVIDPAGSAEMILERLNRFDMNLKMILLTHGHRDHIDACAELAEKTGADVYLHSEDYPMVSSYGYSLPRGYFPESFKPVKEYIPILDGTIISLDEIEIKALHTPGHTMGGICYLAGNAMFSGDVLFAGTIGNTGFETGDYGLMMHSLGKLKKLDFNYRILPGHGEETWLINEKMNNPYLL